MRLQGFPGATVVAGAGLLLTLIALLAAARGPEDMPSFRLRVEVPDPLLLASGAAFLLAVAIMIGIGLSRDRRRREEETEREEEPSKLPWWLQAVLRALPLVPLLAILVVFSFGWQYVENSLLAWSRLVMGAGSDPGAAPAEIPVFSLPWLGWLAGLLLLLAGLATLAMALAAPLRRAHRAMVGTSQQRRAGRAPERGGPGGPRRSRERAGSPPWRSSGATGASSASRPTRA